MILGIRTVIYHVGSENLTAATEWYSEVLGHGPYFKEPFYVGFAVSGFELGLMPDRPAGIGGITAYWGVVEIEEEAARMVELGAKLRGEIEDVGSGIRTVEFDDPFGNIFGLILNPHFDLAKVA